MMGKVVNLRRARKARKRAADDTTAAANLALYGRTKSERGAEEAARVQRERLLDRAKRED